MSSNRLMYDKCAYATTIKEITGSLEYNKIELILSFSNTPNQ